MGGPTLDVTAVTTFLSGSVTTGTIAVASAVLLVVIGIRAYKYVRSAL